MPHSIRERVPSVSGRYEMPVVAVVFAAVTLLMTWPLAGGLTRDIPADLFDPLFNAWVLGWNATHQLRVLRGDWGAFGELWNANIFHPAPLAFAYSEHLTAQTLQILPVYALTGNLILCYNLLSLSTFLLSALGAYLLVRELTGSRRAGFLAGLVYGFLPYRIGQLPHLQVLSSQWMPFALFGFARYFRTRRALALEGAALALILQNLSCGYYVFFFTPLVVAYVLFETARRQLWTDCRHWYGMLLAGLVVVMVTLPFLLPYLELRAAGEIRQRLGVTEFFSADLLAYVTAPEGARLWGPFMQAHPAPEGALFPGFVPAVLACVALADLGRRAWLISSADEKGAGIESRGRHLRSVLVGGSLVVAVLHLAAAGLVAAGLGPAVSTWLPGLTVMSFVRPLLIAGVALVLAGLLSRRVRVFVGHVLRSDVAFFGAAALGAAALSLGPTIQRAGQRLGAGPYLWLYENVPGFDALKVPARFAMIAELALTVLVGFGVAALFTRGRGRWVVASLAAMFLIEATGSPLPTNLLPWEGTRLRMPPPYAEPGPDPPGIYGAVAALPEDAVLLELPIGSLAYDIRYTYNSTFHWRRLVNGYSGSTPSGSLRKARALAEALRAPDRAWRQLVASGATHVIVHTSAWRIPRKGERFCRWLESGGAARLASSGDDVLFALPDSRK